LTKTPQELSREQMQALAQAAKRELGLVPIPAKSQPHVTPAASKETKTLEEYERAKELHRSTAAAPPVIPAVSAWAKPPPATPVSWLQPLTQDSSIPPAMFPAPSPMVSNQSLHRSASSLLQDGAESTWNSQQKGSWAAAAQSQGQSTPPVLQIQSQQQWRQIAVSGKTPQPVPSLHHVMSAPQQLAGLSTRQKPPLTPPATEGVKLTKAQKKNLKRKEKKVAQQMAPDGSDTGSESSAVTAHALNEATGQGNWANHSEAGRWAHCVYLMRASKLKSLVEQFCQVGFAEWQAHSAIARYDVPRRH